MAGKDSQDSQAWRVALGWSFATEDTQEQLTKLGWSVWVGGGLFLCGMLATFMHEFRAIPNFSEVTTG